jgi:hypothetical protein
MRRLPVLLLLAATVACGNGSAGDSGSGIEGRVTIGPQCPVEQMGSPCPDAPYEALITVTREGDTVEQTRSNTDGTFRIPLDPGTYSVVAGPVDGSSMPFGRQVEVVVKPGTLTHVDLSVDSGIR